MRGNLGRWPFRGSVAIGTGKLTPGELRGPRFTRLLPDVYIVAGVPIDQRVWCFAALLYAGPRAVISGQTAARLWGAPIGNEDDPIEITIPSGRRLRASRRIRVVRRRRLPEVTTANGLHLTTPSQTVLDLSERRLRDDAVITAESLCRSGVASLQSLGDLAAAHEGLAVARRLLDVVRLAEPRSESPMETRCRLVLIDGGLPPPSVQVEVFDDGVFVARLDLAYEEWQIAIEYEGDHHRERDAFQRDLARINRLTSLNWIVIRIGPRDVYRHPDELVRHIKELIARRAGGQGAGGRW